MNIILFGFKGSGKTHFGKLLAQKLKRIFIDTDALIEEIYEMKSGDELSIREIHRILGDADFRALETQALGTLGCLEEAVISLGGGAVLDPQNVALLQKIGQMVYLDARFETLKERVLLSGIPTFVDEKDPVASLEQLYRARKPIYEAIAAKRIAVSDLDESQILEELSRGI